MMKLMKNNKQMTVTDSFYFCKLFNDGGYILDFTRDKFSVFCNQILKLDILKYGPSVGKSYEAFINDENQNLEDKIKLIKNLIEYAKKFSLEKKNYDEAAKELSKYENNYDNIFDINGHYSSDYQQQQIASMKENIGKNNSQVISAAKDLVESCFIEILRSNNIEYSKEDSMLVLLEKTLETLNFKDLNTLNVESIKMIKSSLKTINFGISTIRNSYGTGHGKDQFFKMPDSKFSILIINYSDAITTFL